MACSGITHTRTAAPPSGGHGPAGPIRVRGGRSPLLADGIDERVLMITDQRLLADGRIAPHSDADWMDGREGDLLLVNGQYQPVLSVRAGGWLRLRLINACAARYLHLSLPGHLWRQIGADGGWLEQVQAPVKQLLLVPGERADVLVALDGAPGSRAVLQSLPHAWQDGQCRAKPARAHPERALPARRRPGAPAAAAPPGRHRPLPAPAVRREVVLSETMSMEGGKHQMAF